MSRERIPLPKVHFWDDAERLAHSAWESLSLEPPAELRRVAKKLGIDLYFEPFVEEIDGFYLLMPGAPPVVAVNSSYLKPLGRQRFTAAHEIGHHLLRPRPPKGQSRLFFVDGADTRRTMLERACDRFAALLLMPESVVRRWFEELTANPENRVAIIAERFGVSPTAARMRLKELGLPYHAYRYRRR